MSATLYLTRDEQAILRGVAHGMVRRTEHGADMLRKTGSAAGRGMAKVISTQHLRDLGFVAELAPGQVEYQLTDAGREWAAANGVEVTR